MDFGPQNTSLLPANLPVHRTSGQRPVAGHLPLMLDSASVEVDSFDDTKPYNFPYWCLHLNPVVCRICLSHASAVAPGTTGQTCSLLACSNSPEDKSPLHLATQQIYTRYRVYVRTASSPCRPKPALSFSRKTFLPAWEYLL